MPPGTNGTERLEMTLWIRHPLNITVAYSPLAVYYWVALLVPLGEFHDSSLRSCSHSDP